MKKILIETIFIILAFAFILGMIGLAELLSQLITINTIITVVSIALVFSFIYIIRN